MLIPAGETSASFDERMNLGAMFLKMGPLRAGTAACRCSGVLLITETGQRPVSRTFAPTRMWFRCGLICPKLMNDCVF